MTSFTVIEAAGRCRLGEGPLWSTRSNSLFWVDILGQSIHRLCLSDLSVSSWGVPERIGWLIERERASGFVAGFQSGFAYLSLDPLSIEKVSSPEPHLPMNRLNDAKADAAGRIWAGSMDLAGEKPCGALYRLDPDHTVTCVDRDYRIANGPAFSPDGRFLYHTDSGLKIVYRFEVTAHGALEKRIVFLDYGSAGGTPDGMTVDIEGGLWIAEWGASRIARYTPAGRFDRAIDLPASQITSCAFAGDGLDRLFVTSAAEGVPGEPFGGAMFEVCPQTRGFAPCRYGG